ncbi:MAG: arsenic resistance protein [Desulfovibrionales bacterium]
MDHLTLERHQVWIYLGAVISGLLVGMAAPGTAPLLDVLVWPVLALLLFATFVQVPPWHLPDAFRDHRFIAAVLAGNFVLVPALVWALVRWLPEDPALRLGVLMVLLVPCTDWFIAFTRLGRGDTLRAITVTPINLLGQILLLPLYLWLFTDSGLDPGLSFGDLLPALSGLILLPLVLAAFLQRIVSARPGLAVIQRHLSWWPVPLLALTVGMIAASQVHVVGESLPSLVQVFWIYLGYLAIAALLAKILSRIFSLPVAAGRTLAFSLGTRNSFVVLPLALALPSGWETAVVVIVFQSLVELFGMIVYLWWIPSRLFVR